jgi:hypothetical protein
MVRLTVAFADVDHARLAVRFLAGSSLHITATQRPTNDDTDMALVDVEIPNHERSRLETLIAGVHGLLIDDPREARPIVS